LAEIEVRQIRGSAFVVSHLTFELVTRPISFSFFWKTTGAPVVSEPLLLKTSILISAEL